MRVGFFEVEPWAEKYLKENLKNVEKEFYKKRLTTRNASSVQDCACISVFVYSKITKKILDKLPKLRLIITRSTGYDHIDLDECRKRKIRVANVPAYGDNTVAEHTFMLILALTRKLIPSAEKAKKYDFSLKGLRGFDLKDKVIGIIGCGKIGLNVARIAKGFQMNVLVHDLNRDKKLEKKIGFNYVSLNNLLEKSDVISLHVPYNTHTRHMINNVTIGKMKEGVIIINTARGGLINTDHLIRGLRKGKIRGAGLDVLESEALIKEESQLLTGKHSLADLSHVIENNILINIENVIVTPHNAFNSEEAVKRILDTTINCVKYPSDKKKCNFVV